MPGMESTTISTYMTDMALLRKSSGEGVSANAAAAAPEWASRQSGSIDPATAGMPFEYNTVHAARGKLTIVVLPPTGAGTGMKVGVYCRFKGPDKLANVPVLLEQKEFTDADSVYGAALFHIEGPPLACEFTVVTSVAEALVYYSQTT